MKILKLPWLQHKAENKNVEVYSVTVSSDGSRLATGGLDGKVRIWDTDTISRFKDLDDEETPSTKKRKGKEGTIKPLPDKSLCRPLCSVSRHNGAVTVVRFSPSGRFLASGSDDKILLIWEKDEEQASRPKAFGEQDEDLEHWTVRKRVVAHDNDIQDIAWAPDSSILVTVGLDRSIIIWNGNTFERIKRFDIHQSHVKGIVFDPANKYFATASDDRTMRIFRYHKSPNEMTFSVEHVIIEPFKRSPLTSYFRRCSWSPDGQHIAVPNATNGPVSSVAIINRGSWESEISLIGHDAPCEVCAFSPRLFEIKDDPNAEPKMSTVVATAGQDKALAIWNTSRSRPLVVAADICYKTITDLAWSPDGETLYISSLDGMITTICFEPNELGIAVPLERNDAQLHRYGADRETMVFAESIEQLKLEELSELQGKLDNKQMDRVMAKKDNNKEPIVSISTPVISSSSGFDQSKTSPTKINNLTPRQINKLTSSITITKDGKKRISPILISTSSRSSIDQLKLQTAELSSSTKKLAKKTREILSQSEYILPRFGIQTAVQGLRERIDPNAEEEQDIDTIESHAPVPTRPKKSVALIKKSTQHQFPVYIRKVTNFPVSITHNWKNIILPEVIVQLSTCPNLELKSVLEIRNYEEDDIPTEIYSNDHMGQRLFELYYPEKIYQACGFNNEYWAMGSLDGSISIVSRNGKSLYPRIELGSAITVLECQGWKLMAITSLGVVYVWDLKTFKAIIRGVSLASILNSQVGLVTDKRSVMFGKPPEITDIKINKNGLPLISLDNHEVYSFDLNLQTWIKVTDPWYFQFDNINYLGTGLLGRTYNRVKMNVRRSNMGVEDTRFRNSIEMAYLSNYKCVINSLGEDGKQEIDTQIQNTNN